MKDSKAEIRWVKDGKGNLMGVGKAKDVFKDSKAGRKGKGIVSDNTLGQKLQLEPVTLDTPRGLGKQSEAMFPDSLLAEKPRLKLYCDKPACFAHYVANEKLKVTTEKQIKRKVAKELAKMTPEEIGDFGDIEKPQRFEYEKVDYGKYERDIHKLRKALAESEANRKEELEEAFRLGRDEQWKGDKERLAKKDDEIKRLLKYYGDDEVSLQKKLAEKDNKMIEMSKGMKIIHEAQKKEIVCLRKDKELANGIRNKVEEAFSKSVMEINRLKSMMQKSDMFRSDMVEENVRLKSERSELIKAVTELENPYHSSDLRNGFELARRKVLELIKGDGK